MSFSLITKPLLILSLSLYCFSSNGQSKGLALAQAAAELRQDEVTYDPSYFSIDYPNGDVPADKGVCTDVVIRAYRKLGLDLQKRVHEDMKANFTAYPNNWGLKQPDSNIDHRRVPNLMCFFKRENAALPISQKPKDYQAGDIVCWNLGGGILHIGIVVLAKSPSGIPLIMHNIGAGQVVQNMLFEYQIIGHYRYLAPLKKT